MRPRDGAGDEGTDANLQKTRILRLIAATILVNGLLLGPVWVVPGTGPAPWLAIEAGLLVGLFAALPPARWSAVASTVAGIGVVVLTLVALGDATLRLSLGRPANLYTDLWLLGSVRHLLVGSVGPVLAALVALLAIAAASLIAALLAFLLRPVRVSRPRRFAAAGVLSLLVFSVVATRTGRAHASTSRTDLPAVRLAAEQTERFLAMTGERERFADALALYPGSYADLPGLLSGLEGSDVIFGFIESYGISALYDPRYAPVVGPRLDDLGRRMQAAGLTLVSGRLVAPSQGGQSWYAHGSMLSGIWLDNQLRYDMLLASGRETLVDDFETAGYRTVALMPAISTAWPEGERFGYEEIHAATNIAYEGPPLNWVTMPDQFTWSYFEDTIRRKDTRPLFAEIGLISSHAPWTPILTVVEDWGSIGDGTVFNSWKDAGERPEELWLDTKRVREHYALSVEYAVHAAAAYAERFVDDHTLLILLGDHQPAPLITGDGASWDVPVHVVSGDPELVAPFRAWGFVDGAWPETAGEAVGMDHFRDWFVRAYSGS